MLKRNRLEDLWKLNLLAKYIRQPKQFFSAPKSESSNDVHSQIAVIWNMKLKFILQVRQIRKTTLREFELAFRLARFEVGTLYQLSWNVWEVFEDCSRRCPQTWCCNIHFAVLLEASTSTDTVPTEQQVWVLSVVCDGDRTIDADYKWGLRSSSCSR